MKEGNCDLCVLLQKCMGFVEGETGSCIETCVTCDVDITEDVSIKVEAIDVKEEVRIKVEESKDVKAEVSIKGEESVYMKDEIPEIPPVKTQNQVRLQGVCEVVAVHAFRPFIIPKG